MQGNITDQGDVWTVVTWGAASLRQVLGVVCESAYLP